MDHGSEGQPEAPTDELHPTLDYIGLGDEQALANAIGTVSAGTVHITVTEIGLFASTVVDGSPRYRLVSAVALGS